MNQYKYYFLIIGLFFSISAFSMQCIKSGCGGQLCIDKKEDNGISTCEYKESYQCYKKSVCEKQKNGYCGWTSNPEFETCLIEKRAKMNSSIPSFSVH